MTSVGLGGEGELRQYHQYYVQRRLLVNHVKQRLSRTKCINLFWTSAGWTTKRGRGRGINCLTKPQSKVTFFQRISLPQRCGNTTKLVDDHCSGDSFNTWMFLSSIFPHKSRFSPLPRLCSRLQE